MCQPYGENIFSTQYPLEEEPDNETQNKMSNHERNLTTEEKQKKKAQAPTRTRSNLVHSRHHVVLSPTLQTEMEMNTAHREQGSYCVACCTLGKHRVRQIPVAIQVHNGHDQGVRQQSSKRKSTSATEEFDPPLRFIPLRYGTRVAVSAY